MAKVKTTETPAEKRLRAMYKLQLIDSKIDKIKTVRGELPLEVEDLEDEVTGLATRLKKINDEVAELQAENSAKKNLITDAIAAIKKYEEQQKNVRNNREFDALTKEIEFQELEIELAQKHIREYSAQIEHKSTVIEETKEKLAERQNHLDHKKSELDNILNETQKEETSLTEKSDKFKKDIEERLVKAYTRIRKNVKNGMAVVTIERGASGGSFFTIPPQVQVEIAARRKVIIDEHSGRILVDQELAREEEEKMEKMFKKLS